MTNTADVCFISLFSSENYEKKCTAVRVAGTMTEIQTYYLPNTSYILSLHQHAQ